MPGKPPSSNPESSNMPGREGGAKTARIVARTEPCKRDHFYHIARELRLDAANILNCLVDAFVEAYDARGEVSFPLKIQLVPCGKGQGTPCGHHKPKPAGGKRSRSKGG
jgi:hypothetical protein